jgi:ribosomal protein L11 methyltransferase
MSDDDIEAGELDEEPRTWPALDIERVDPDTTDLIQAFLTDFNVFAIDDNEPGVLRVFFDDEDRRDEAGEAVADRFPAIAVTLVDVADEDWAARSQASLRAIKVGDLVIAPPWDVTFQGSHFNRPIVIQPSMGFGTGHHATTRLCLLALQQLDLTGLHVIDVGTGSGVLAIAASRLGAGRVVGIDDDADAIAAAQDNLALNADAGMSVDFHVGDVRAERSQQFDVVVANLTGGLLISAAFRLQALATTDGVLVLSGLMESEEHDVLRAFDRFELDSRTQEDEWVCLELAPHGE